MSRRLAGAAAALVVALVVPPALPAESPAGRVHHALDVQLDPATGRLTVVDQVRVPRGGEVEFLLNGQLELNHSAPAAELQPLGDVAPFAGINAAAADLAASGGLKRYRVRLPEGGGTLALAYSGPFDFGLGAEEEQYQRGFRETAGIVSREGVYLAGNGFWVPQFDRGLVEFTLTATAPEGWHLVSQGNGVSRDAAGRARWDSAGPMDEIYLVGGPLTRYRQAAGAVEAEVYLRTPDEALAGKYLQATAQYLEMYRGLLGPYPYGKFALVENFWETGYGMPSFTLLGPQVIRLPFIIASSYPHEILHNWWGNSVFVDYASGNWCEGLTAYLADHLIQEQRGQGEAYRRDTLQKYRSYVRDGRDFPLVEFRARHSAATEAVGYGKALMGFHMLRRALGDDAFREWAARFYREEKGQQASFADIRRTMEAVAKRDLAHFFRDWTERTGAAELAVEVVGVVPVEGGFDLRGRLRQNQGGEPFALDVPITVQTTGAAVETTVPSAAVETPFMIRVPERPLALQVDPAFDLFRRLDPREIPPSIGQIFGEPRVLAVLPADASAEESAAWRTLVESWKTDAHSPEFTTDRELTELEELPADRAVWLLGRGNRLAPRFLAGAAGVAIDAAGLGVDGEHIPFAGHSAVVVVRHPANAERALGWIAADPLAALPGLGRKLPHYGKYSYLGFAGAEPVNTVKGQWAASDSPLRVDLRPAAERAAALPALALAPRRPLAELPPVFSEKKLAEHVTWLAAPERQGRGIGTAGLDAAAEYVAAQLQAIGLQPGGDGGSWFQSFTTGKSPDGKPVTLRNVIGILPGAKPELAGQSAIVSAHYDHLGFGFPDAHAEFKGQLHPGADDNASGVAVLIELARAAAAGAKPSRTLVFAAFAGEEAGLLGARHYAAHPLFPLDKTLGVVNLDTVGRLGAQKVTILAAGTATEWPHIFRGASFVTGVESRSIPDQAEASDQMAFIEKGVPAIQVFTQAHADYHRPGDTADKVDVAGLVKVATLVQECVGYLAERPEPLTVTISPPGAGAGASPSGPPGGAPASGGRKVTVGTVPDFAFAGPGVKVDQVVPGSPAEKAGIRAGDVLVKLAGQPIESLRGYSQILATLTPGQVIEVEIERDGARQAIPVTVVAR